MLISRFVRRLFARTSQGARSSVPKLLLALFVLAALPALAYWRGLGNDPSQLGANASEMTIENLERSGERINLVLKEKGGPRRMVVAVGQPEALSIVEDMNPNSQFQFQPVTAYAMSRRLIENMGGKVERVVVNNATDRELFAKVVLSKDSGEIVVDASPSDAIALAVRTKAPIYVDAVVLDKVGVVSGR